MRDALGRSVRPVSAAEGVVHIDVAQARRVVARSADRWLLPRRGSADSRAAAPACDSSWRASLGGHLAHAVGREGNVDRFAQRVIEQRAQPVHHRPQAVFGIGLSLGAPQVRGHDHFGVMAQRVLERGQGLFDPGVVENLQTVSESGTLKSTRIKRYLLFRSRSRMESFAMAVPLKKSFSGVA